MPSAQSYPLSPGPAFNAFMDKSKSLETARLAEAIPKAYFEPRTWRGVAGFLTSYALYIGAILGVAYTHWEFYLPLYLIAGLGGWGLHCIAHDCGHNSFSRNKKLNIIIGHLSLLPLLYPFYSWKHVHNLHHLHTNNLELDTDWRPIPYEMYKRMSFGQRFVYMGTRTSLFWAGTINYWIVSGFRPNFFPKKDMRSDVKRSIVFVVLASIIYFSTLIYFTGIAGFFLFFFAPWIAIHAWFSMTTLMHHTSTDIPFVTSEHWTPNASRLLVTTDYRYPKWLLFLTHNISIHTAHHVAPIVPFYNLQKAQLALKQAYPGMIQEKNFSFGELLQIIKRCHFYDLNSSYYTTAPNLNISTRLVNASYQLGGLLIPGLAGRIATNAFSRSRFKRPHTFRVPLGAKTFEITNNEDIRQGYLWKNEGPTVLLVHGWGSNSSSMMSFVKPLLDLGFQVATFDAPAHGESAGNKTTMTRFVKAVSDTLNSLDNVQAIISHSLGAIASVAAIADATPKQAEMIKRLVLIAAPASLSAVLERWSTNQYQQLPRTVISKIYDRLQVQNGVPVSHWDISALGADMNIPLLVIHDEHDPMVPLAEAQKLKNSLKNTRLEQTSGLGHNRILSATSVRQLITRFISEPYFTPTNLEPNHDRNRNTI